MTNIQHLEAYIEARNAFARIFKDKEYSIAHLSSSDRLELLRRIENELSPENLSCDGELRGKALHDKARRLNGAKDALLGM